MFRGLLYLLFNGGGILVVSAAICRNGGMAYTAVSKAVFIRVRVSFPVPTTLTGMLLPRHKNSIAKVLLLQQVVRIAKVKTSAEFENAVRRFLGLVSPLHFFE